MKIRQLHICVLLILVIGLFNTAQAQVVFGQPASGNAQFIYQNWKITDSDNNETTLTQWVAPLYAYIPIADEWEIIFTSSTAGSTLEGMGDDKLKLNGLNDTRLALYRSLMQDKILIGIGVNLPTGKKALTNEEVSVSSYLTESFLNMPVKSYGEGIGVNVEAGYVYSRDVYTYGIGAGYILKGSYEPLEGVDDYKPGNIFRAGAFGTVNSGNITARLSFVYNIFSDDKSDDSPVFRDGNMADARLSFDYKNDGMTVLFGVREIIRGKDKRLAVGELKTEPEKSHGAETRVFSTIGYALTEKVNLKALVDYKNVAANGYAEDHSRHIGSSNYFGIGFGGSSSLTANLNGFMEFEYFTGSADDGDLDLSGWQVVVGAGAKF